MDLSVLQGASKTISKYKPPILIEHSDNQVSILDSLKEELNKYKYKFEIYKNNLLAN